MLCYFLFSTAWLAWRDKCARNIQRVARGYIARYYVRKKIERMYDEAMLRIEREREAMLVAREKAATALVQRIWRGKIGRAVAQAREEQLERMRRVAEQMEQHADSMKLENLVYEDKVKREFALDAKAKHEVEARKPVDVAAKRDIVLWRRRWRSTRTR